MLPIDVLSGERKVSALPRWSWQESHAAVNPQGDLQWQPRPFVFEKGASVRYIDFDAGDDANAGDSSSDAWKHHPWDPQATGKSASCSGIHTYVFKRGVCYRGQLLVKDAGRPDDPIRLTSDPAWGQGEAVLCGSERVMHWMKGAAHKDIPAPEKVWWADLDFAPRSVWSVAKDGAIARIPLASRAELGGFQSGRCEERVVGLGQSAQGVWQHDHERARPGDAPRHRHEARQRQTGGLLQGRADLARVQAG